MASKGWYKRKLYAFYIKHSELFRVSGAPRRKGGPPKGVPPPPPPDRRFSGRLRSGLGGGEPFATLCKIWPPWVLSSRLLLWIFWWKSTVNYLIHKSNFVFVFRNRWVCYEKVLKTSALIDKTKNPTAWK